MYMYMCMYRYMYRYMYMCMYMYMYMYVCMNMPGAGVCGASRIEAASAPKRQTPRISRGPNRNIPCS